ncbi:MAG: hypothetical protein ACYCU3_22535, partial [Streptosporangiaceae bacterium]
MLRYRESLGLLPAVRGRPGGKAWLAEAGRPAVRGRPGRTAA